MPSCGILFVSVEGEIARNRATRKRQNETKQRRNKMNWNETMSVDEENETTETKELAEFESRLSKETKKEKKHNKGEKTMKTKKEKKQNKKATKTAKPRVKKAKRLTEQQLKTKYPHVVLGTLQFDEKEQRNRVKIACQQKGCKKTRTVATSDLFQVRFCVECTKANRNASRKKKA